MVYKRLRELRSRHDKKIFEKILKATEEDIKFNRVGFSKCTSPKEFISILEMCEIATLRAVGDIAC